MPPHALASEAAPQKRFAERVRELCDSRVRNFVSALHLCHIAERQGTEVGNVILRLGGFLVELRGLELEQCGDKQNGALPFFGHGVPAV